MATRSLPNHASAEALAYTPAETGYSDDTEPRIRAYLASVRPLRGCAGMSEREPYQRGRFVIERRIALCAHGTDSPRPQLSAAQCADVLYFVRCSEPLKPATWWKEPENAPSHLVGLCFVLEAVENSLRGKGERS